MFHRKRFRSAIAIILTLMLTVVAVQVVLADSHITNPPPPPGEIDEEDTTPPPPPVVATPEPPIRRYIRNRRASIRRNRRSAGTSDPPDHRHPPDMGNGNGDGDGDGDMMASSPSSWPPPNAIVHHAATPIQISALGGGLHVYFIGPDGASKFRHRYRFLQHPGGDLSQRRRGLALHRHQCGLRQIG